MPESGSDDLDQLKTGRNPETGEGILVLTRVNAARPDYIGGVVSPAREFGATKVTAAGGSETHDRLAGGRDGE